MKKTFYKLFYASPSDIEGMKMESMKMAFSSLLLVLYITTTDLCVIAQYAKNWKKKKNSFLHNAAYTSHLSTVKINEIYWPIPSTWKKRNRGKLKRFPYEIYPHQNFSCYQRLSSIMVEVKSVYDMLFMVVPYSHHFRQLNSSLN